jgi:SAM-dependent methyltransferase
MNATRVINESQQKSYQKTDEEHAKHLFHIFENVVAEKNEKENIQILDVGGGVANFSVLISEHFNGRAKVYCLDNTRYDAWDGFSDRVAFKLGSADEMVAMFGEKAFDIIFFNRVFHHLVRDGFKQTVDGICRVLAQTRTCLKDDGCLCITDETADSYLDGMSTWLIYRLTTIRNRRLATFLKRFDAKSAGIGVCFLSTKKWARILAQEGYVQATVNTGIIRPLKWWIRTPLFLKENRLHVCWVCRKNADSL